MLKWLITCSKIILGSYESLNYGNFERETYKIHEYLYLYQDISHFIWLLLDPPPTFREFVSLRKIEFRFVFLAHSLFDNMLGYYHLLQVLTLQYCDGFAHFYINGSQLQYLDVLGSSDDVTLENTWNPTNITNYMWEQYFFSWRF